MICNFYKAETEEKCTCKGEVPDIWQAFRTEVAQIIQLMDTGDFPRASTKLHNLMNMLNQ